MHVSLFMAVSRQRDTEVRERAWNLPTCAVVLPPAWARGEGDTQFWPTTGRLSRNLSSQMRAGGPLLRRRGPACKLCILDAPVVCLLFARQPPSQQGAEPPSRSWQMALLISHDYVFYLKLTYFPYIFISLVLIPHSGFSCHVSYFPMKQGGPWMWTDEHKPVIWESIFIKGDKLRSAYGFSSGVTHISDKCYRILLCSGYFGIFMIQFEKQF